MGKPDEMWETIAIVATDWDKKNWHSIYFHLFTACWEIDPHKRPQFKVISKQLDDIVKSGFMQTPHESFHNMQDCWKKEIAEVLHELRLKEKVSGEMQSDPNNSELNSISENESL